ncbi:MAG: hypothetical protein ABS882_00815 [Lysinibacillus sp.]
MNKNIRLFKISMVLTIFGFLLIMSNGWTGNLLANIWLKMVGGFADTNHYEFQRNTFSSSFLSLGNILFGVGLLTMLFSWYKKLEA